MPNFGEIQWELKFSKDKSNSNRVESFEFFLDYCKTKLPAHNLIKSYNVFLVERKRLQDELKKCFRI